MIQRCAVHQHDQNEPSRWPPERLDSSPDVPVLPDVSEGTVWIDVNNNQTFVFQHHVWRRSDQLCDCCSVNFDDIYSVPGIIVPGD